MPNDWQGKVCLITGASAGLGLSVARQLVRRGATALLVARRTPPLESAAAELNALGRGVGSAAAFPGDVCSQADVDRLAAEVQGRFGRLDLLLHAAGRSSRSPILETTPEDFQQLWDVNFLAAVRLTRALTPLVVSSGGHLVYVGSLASKIAARYLGAYPASKHALAAYCQQLRLELGSQGVHVLLVCPGPLRRDDAGTRYAEESTNVPPEAQRPGGGAKLSLLDPDRLAEQIVKACQRRRAELVVPASSRLLFTLAQISPRLGDWLLTRLTSS
jgi:NAD(P)-dependent dehydrogenase (short-subunit alcohol dehydrogenase family)